MKYTVERFFSNLKHECLGWSYQNFYDVLKYLIYEMRDKIGHPFMGDRYQNLRFVMNVPLHNEFYTSCKISGHDSTIYRGIPIISEPSFYVNDSKSPYGIVRLIYEEPEVQIKHSIQKEAYEFWTKQLGAFLPSAKPHIDHVKFDGPATIVFWKDGTKTVVKYDGKGRKDKRHAILYAFIRKIYGEGKPYHDILNEIEEALE